MRIRAGGSIPGRAMMYPGHAKTHHAALWPPRCEEAIDVRRTCLVRHGLLAVGPAAAPPAGRAVGGCLPLRFVPPPAERPGAARWARPVTADSRRHAQQSVPPVNVPSAAVISARTRVQVPISRRLRVLADWAATARKVCQAGAQNQLGCQACAWRLSICGKISPLRAPRLGRRCRPSFATDALSRRIP